MDGTDILDFKIMAPNIYFSSKCYILFWSHAPPRGDLENFNDAKLKLEICVIHLGEIW